MQSTFSEPSPAQRTRSPLCESFSANSDRQQASHCQRLHQCPQGFFLNVCTAFKKKKASPSIEHNCSHVASLTLTFSACTYASECIAPAATSLIVKHHSSLVSTVGTSVRRASQIFVVFLKHTHRPQFALCLSRSIHIRLRCLSMDEQPSPDSFAATPWISEIRPLSLAGCAVCGFVVLGFWVRPASRRSSFRIAQSRHDWAPELSCRRTQSISRTLAYSG